MSGNNGDAEWGRFSVAAREALVAATGVPADGLRPEYHLQDDLGLDSFGVLVFTGELEERLGVVLPTSDAEPTLANLYHLVTMSPAWPGGEQ